VTAGWEVRWHRWQVGLRAYVHYEIHSYGDVEEEVTMEKPRSEKEEISLLVSIVWISSCEGVDEDCHKILIKQYLKWLVTKLPQSPPKPTPDYQL
jgi:hypothetical protein